MSREGNKETHTLSSGLFRGKFVRLASDSPETFARSTTRWGRNSEYARLLSTGPAQLYSVKASTEFFEKLMDPNQMEVFHFTIHTLEDDRLIGDVSLEIIDWNHRDAYTGIGLGEPEDWGKGYGTEAMQLALQYAFTELNLHRVTLNVFEYNPRAIRSYEKAGFTVEGRLRKFLLRDGRRWDLIYMGILKSDWLAQQADGIQNTYHKETTEA